MSTIRYTRIDINIYVRFSGQLFLKKIVIRKKDLCDVFGCNNDRLFPEKYTLKFSFCSRNVGKYCASAPLGIQ